MRRESLLIVIRDSTNFKPAPIHAKMHFVIFSALVQAVWMGLAAALRAARAFVR